MTLVMFDIDGTLTGSFALDSATFVDALSDVFGFREVSDDWASYPHVTDSGVLAELFRVRLGRAPTEREVTRMQAHFLALLTERVDAAGGIPPMRGAAEALARLRASPDYAVSYASGGWRETALFKLRSAGLPTEKIPGAFSDDDPTREGICRVSRQRAVAHYGQDFSRVIYVGDGAWDVRTSGRLGYGFIGVGRNGGAEKLRAEGAVQVLEDFADLDDFLKRLASKQAA